MFLQRTKLRITWALPLGVIFVPRRPVTHQSSSHPLENPTVTGKMWLTWVKMVKRRSRVVVPSSRWGWEGSRCLFWWQCLVVKWYLGTIWNYVKYQISFLDLCHTLPDKSYISFIHIPQPTNAHQICSLPSIQFSHNFGYTKTNLVSSTSASPIHKVVNPKPVCVTPKNAQPWRTPRICHQDPKKISNLQPAWGYQLWESSCLDESWWQGANWNNWKPPLVRGRSR